MHSALSVLHANVLVGANLGRGMSENINREVSKHRHVE